MGATGSTATRATSSSCRPAACTVSANEADEPASVLMLFAPGAPREPYFEGLAHLGDLTDEQRRAWFDANDNFFPE